MGVSYNKLFKLLIDKGMKKTELRKVTGISPNTLTKLSNNEFVSMEVLVKICRVLSCDIGDIVEITKSLENGTGNLAASGDELL
ncbi:helix-turn-helix transcriptional regulator [Paenibacillus mesophilus]|uniref:helix-turn-helix domain-containing protein n=1 Tax=Paenibacillus mesophilus TaxID=2582849 RepID=UPI00110D5869|nr:helix-turn-helix transcriptional regulator [Paenibacillus mesophilus]TMV47049.1 helix-turn-helix transcriptional regulator [Paenibacillus mesophilus]